MCSGSFSDFVNSGLSCAIFTWLFGLNSIGLQGTKVLEDREIRHSFCVTNEGSPPQSASPGITKYTGALAAPEWEDTEPGRVFSFPWYLAKITWSKKGNFETLCNVKVDISSASYATNYTGRTGYKREFDVILLVGLTELKAQVSWIDSRTVRIHITLHVFVHLTRFRVRGYRGRREGS